jgi:hypothetical protein
MVLLVLRTGCLFDVHVYLNDVDTHLMYYLPT